VTNTMISNFLHNCLPTKMEETVCSETSAYKIQTPGNYPEESIQQIQWSLRIINSQTIEKMVLKEFH